MARVELHNISKVFPGGVKAVDGVSLSVADQEFVVLVGPSGCGKTTTLRMIAGLENPDEGTIHIGDRVANHIPPKDRDIAVVFQSYALYPHMTVYGNLSFALRLRMMPGLLSRLTSPGRAREVKEEIRKRVHAVADMLEIRHLLDRKPRELSGGQRQRVAVGRAIIRQPVAFLFDEPLSNLDARLRITTRAELKRLHQRLRTTTIYVTHDQEEAMTLGDRIVVMKDGKILQADPPLVTYHRPNNRFVAGFIGMPPMNFFEGLLAEFEGGRFGFEETKNLPSTSAVVEAGDGKSKTEMSAEPVNGLTSQSKGFRLSLPDPAQVARDRLSRWIGKQVVLGIRPEHIYLTPVRDQGGLIVTQPLDVEVLIHEPLGRSVDLYMKTILHNQVVARVESPDDLASPVLQSGSSAIVHVDVRRVHLFEPGETGMNLSLEASASGTSSVELSHAMA